MTSTTKYYLILSLLLLSVSGHTWVSCANYVNGNCLGYIRNFVGRNTPTSVVDNYYTTKALGRPNDFPICAPYQNTSTYSQQYPMTAVNAGESVYVMYTPNGHSQPGDHGLTTTSRIHWTGSTTSFLNVRGDLNAGNQLASWNYGSNCAQLPTPNVASLPCTNAFTIPANTPPGIYQFVWYWPYDRDQAQVPIGEEYFSCFDVNVGNAQVQNPPTQAANPTTQAANPTTQAANPSTQAANPTTQGGNPQTSQAGNPSTQGGNPNPGLCATSLADCKSFCAPAAASVCECDPTTGAKNVKCDTAATADGVQTFVVALSLTATLLALL